MSRCVISILFNLGNGRPFSGRRRTTYGFETEVLGRPSSPVPMRLQGSGTNPRRPGVLGGKQGLLTTKSQFVIGHFQELRIHVSDALALGVEQELVVAAVSTDCNDRIRLCSKGTNARRA